MEAFHHFFAALERRRSRRRENYSRDEGADNRSMEIFVLRKIFENWKTAHAAAGELNRPFAQTFFEFIKIDIVPSA